MSESPQGENKTGTPRARKISVGAGQICHADEAFVKMSEFWYLRLQFYQND